MVPECKRAFIANYGKAPPHALQDCKPSEPDLASLPESVDTISPSFVAIFREAEQARQLGLAQVAGPGFRKAFEFLVKDFAKNKSPDEAETIEKMFSGQVVERFLTDPRIGKLAKRALWLGNDESHYLRRWSDKDIDDLIVLIRLSAGWIEMECLSESYVKDMPD